MSTLINPELKMTVYVKSMIQKKALNCTGTFTALSLLSLLHHGQTD